MEKPIPYYDREGRSRGFRTLEAARLLIQNGLVTGAYGRKGHLKAIYGKREDGSCAMERQPRAGTRYSFIEGLEHGRCWKLRRVDGRDDSGLPLDARGVFFQVIADCTVP